MVKVDASSDLCDFSVAAAGELMLAQAAECFYQKAEYGMIRTLISYHYYHLLFQLYCYDCENIMLINNELRVCVLKDNTSSPVTSQIATQAADFYDIAYKAAKHANSFGKYRFPKVKTFTFTLYFVSYRNDINML